MLSCSRLRLPTASVNNNVNIRFIQPHGALVGRFGAEFAYCFHAKPSEIVWKPSNSESAKPTTKVGMVKTRKVDTSKQGNPIDVYSGVGKKPNTEILMKSTFSAMRKAREMGRDKIGVHLPTECEVPVDAEGNPQPKKIMSILRQSDCTTTNMLQLFQNPSTSTQQEEESSSNKKSNTKKNNNNSKQQELDTTKFLSENELLEKLSTYSHMAAYEYNDKKTDAFIIPKNDKHALEKLNYKPQLSFWRGYECLDKSPSVKTGRIIANNVNMARTWQNIRPDIGSPQYFTDLALKALGFTGNGTKSGFHSNVRVIDVIKGKQLQKKGMNLMYGVGKGASDANQPILVVLEYNGAKNKSDKATALVGKGIVMDTGGLNLKPFGNMESMHQDMGGSAAVFGAFKSCVELKLEQNIVCVLGFANNACGSNAYHPSEIITSLKGTTVEILNTDAEGRLVLADAMTYVQKHAETTCVVDTVIDVATLTGAMCVALGDDRAGIFSNDATLCRNLVAASETSLEPLWPMPVGPEHHKKLKSNTLADMANIGGGRYGGACTAAAFLQHFVEKHDDCLIARGKKAAPAKTKINDDDEEEDEDQPECSAVGSDEPESKMNRWAHLDIAGPGMGGSKATDRNPPGSTGYGAALLTEYFRKL